MKFEFVEFNPRRAQRGAEAAQVMVTDDQGEEHLLWMSRSDITRNMMAFGRCDALTQAQTAYAAMDKGGDHVDR